MENLAIEKSESQWFIVTCIFLKWQYWWWYWFWLNAFSLYLCIHQFFYGKNSLWTAKKIPNNCQFIRKLHLSIKQIFMLDRNGSEGGNDDWNWRWFSLHNFDWNEWSAQCFYCDDINFDEKNDCETSGCINIKIVARTSAHTHTHIHAALFPFALCAINGNQKVFAVLCAQNTIFIVCTVKMIFIDDEMQWTRKWGKLNLFRCRCCFFL